MPIAILSDPSQSDWRKTPPRRPSFVRPSVSQLPVSPLEKVAFSQRSAGHRWWVPIST